MTPTKPNMPKACPYVRVILLIPLIQLGLTIGGAALIIAQPRIMCVVWKWRLFAFENERDKRGHIAHVHFTVGIDVAKGVG